MFLSLIPAGITWGLSTYAISAFDKAVRHRRELNTIRDQFYFTASVVPTVSNELNPRASISSFAVSSPSNVSAIPTTTPYTEPSPIDLSNVSVCHPCAGNEVIQNISLAQLSPWQTWSLILLLFLFFAIASYVGLLFEERREDREALKTASEQINALEKVNDKTLQELASTKSATKVLNAECKKDANGARIAEVKMENLQEELNATIFMAEKYYKEVQRLTVIESEHSTCNGSIKLLVERINIARIKAEIVTAERDNLVAENKKANIKLDTVQNLYAESKGKSDRAQEEINKWRQKSETSWAKMTTMIQTMKDLQDEQKKNSNTALHLENLEKDYTTSQEQFETAKSKISEYEGSLMEAAKARSSLRDRLTVTDAEIEMLKHKAEESGEALREKQSELDRMSERYKLESSLREEAEQRLNATTRRRSEALENIASATYRRDGNSNLRVQLERLQVELAASNKREEQLEATILRLEQRHTPTLPAVSLDVYEDEFNPESAIRGETADIEEHRDTAGPENHSSSQGRDYIVEGPLDDGIWKGKGRAAEAQDARSAAEHAAPELAATPEPDQELEADESFVDEVGSGGDGSASAPSQKKKKQRGGRRYQKSKLAKQRALAAASVGNMLQTSYAVEHDANQQFSR